MRNKEHTYYCENPKQQRWPVAEHFRLVTDDDPIDVRQREQQLEDRDRKNFSRRTLRDKALYDA